MSTARVIGGAMTFEDFERTLHDAKPPSALTPALKGLWLARKGQWDLAHSAVQEESDRASAWVHAYLHREEGDDWNARYWYGKAKKIPYNGSLEDEWSTMVRELLG